VSESVSMSAFVVTTCSSGRTAPGPPAFVGRTSTKCYLSRRELLRSLALTPAVLLVPKTTYAQTISDETVGYEFVVPDSFTENSTVLSGGRKLYLYVKDDINVSAIATPIPGDFQKLTSFGSVDNVANTILPKEVNGKMNKVTAKPDTYIFDYEIKPPSQPEKRLITLFTIRPGQYIVTLTAQSNAENFAEHETQIRSIVDSFSLGKLPGY